MINKVKHEKYLISLLCREFISNEIYNEARFIHNYLCELGLKTPAAWFDDDNKKMEYYWYSHISCTSGTLLVEFNGSGQFFFFYRDKETQEHFYEDWDGKSPLSSQLLSKIEWFES